jgi:hypothetical protein
MLRHPRILEAGMLGKKAILVLIALVAAFSLAAPANADFWGGFFGPGPGSNRPEREQAPFFSAEQEPQLGWRGDLGRVRHHHPFAAYRRAKPVLTMAQHNSLRKRHFAALRPPETIRDDERAGGKAASLALAPDQVKSDPTLRRGDAVVGKNGVEVYVGAGKAVSADGFVSLADYHRFSRRMSARLDAYFATAARRSLARQFLALSAGAPPAPNDAGKVITDASGRKMRHVGAFQPPPLKP